MFIVGKSFFSEMLSKFSIKTIAPVCVIHILIFRLAFDGFDKLGTLAVDFACSKHSRFMVGFAGKENH